MATLFNNTEITNAFFNGTELDKIYFNGVLVFEKGGKYKRRIMVGDNLKGKILISDFPTNFKEELINIVSPDVTQVNVISSTNDQSLFFGLYVEKYDSPIYGTPTTYVVAGRVDSNRNLYIYTVEDNYEGINNYDNYQVQSTEDIVISEINDSAIYRHIFIEDENIRPLKVGDYVLDNTIFYFTFPDDLYLKGNDTAGKHLIAIEQDPIIDDKGNNWVLTASNWYTGNKSIVYGHGTSSSTGYNVKNSIYDYDSEEEKLKKNLSKVIAKDMENRNGNIHYYCRGKVVGIYKSQNFASHILVDTRTLGTTGYKRRIQVGDKLRNKNIYGDFSENFSNELINYYSGSSNSNIFIAPVNSDTTVINKFHDIYGNTPAGDTVRAEFSDEHVFYHLHTDGTVEINNIFSMPSDINYEVGEVIEDSPTYRHLYIEDNKIRPIQVGDKITKNTKFYFTIPDNFADNNPTQMIYILTASSSDNDVNSYIWYTETEGFSPPHLYINFNGISGYNIEEIYVIDNNKKVIKNVSSTNLKLTKPITVNYIDTSQVAKNIIKNILVDITTLG